MSNYLSLFHLIDIPLVLMDDLMVIIHYNEAFQEYIELSKEDIEGKKISELLPIKNYILDGPKELIHHKTVKKHLKYADITFKRLTLGIQNYILVTIIDETTNQLNLIEKEISEQNLAQALENTPNLAIQWFNEKGQVVYWNKTSELLYGYKKEEAIGKTLEQLVYSKLDFEEFLHITEKIKKTNKPHGPVEVIITDKNGIKKNVLITTYMIHTKKSQPIFVCVDIDITHQKEIENQNIEISILNNAIIENAGYSIIASDKNGIITQFNSAASKMLGYSSEEIIGKTSPKIFHDKDEVLARKAILEKEFNTTIDDLFKVFVLKSDLGLSNVHEYTYIKKDGTRFPVLLSVTALKNNKGEIDGYLGIAADLTVQKQSELFIKLQNEELLKINNELDKFVYSASHDLRAPVTSILGLIDIALIENEPKNFIDYFLMLKKTVLQMDEFIQEIVNYSRNSRTEIILENVNLYNLINEIIDQFTYLNNFQKIKIGLEFSKDLNIVIDKRRLKIVLSNLISNSIKYMDINKDNPYINLEINNSTHVLQIILKDNGIGVKEEDLPRLFDMFYRATEISKGSGIGLYIVKEVLEKLNGIINVTSQIGQGTTFSITLPNNQ